MAPGSPIKLSTEFPGLMNEKNEKKPGPLLFKIMKMTPEEGKFDVKLKYDDLSGIVQYQEDTLQFDKEGVYPDCGIRKSILLVYYSDLMKGKAKKKKFSRSQNSSILLNSKRKIT
jgi:hypothetical protein